MFGPHGDIVAFTLPILISVLSVPLLYAYVPAGEIPLWGYLSIVVFTDVAHVWSTLFRTYFNASEYTRRRALYSVLPVALFVLQVAIHWLFGEALFWTLIGYLAIYHFVKQQYGLLMVAQIRERNFRSLNRDKRLLYALALLPICVWHCDDSRTFDWFNRSDPFLFASWSDVATNTVLANVSGWDITPLLISYVAWIAVWLAFFSFMASDVLFSVRERKRFPIIRALILFYSGLTWSVGVLVNHKMIGLMFLNLFHAFPSFLIVFCSAMNSWRDPAESPAVHWRDAIGRFFTGSKSRFPLYMAFLLILGALEEFLWEIFVWRDYFDEIPYVSSFFSSDGQRVSLFNSCLVSGLILPQTVHYVLDMYIWKMRSPRGGPEENPGLKRALGIAPLE